MNDTERTPSLQPYRSTLPATPGIYKITCTPTMGTYIGASKNCRARTNQHRRQLLAGTHSNKKMQADWQAHGPEAFVFEIAELIPDADDLAAAENRLMDQHSAVGQCYNRQPSSNMRRMPQGDKDIATYKIFHQWRVALYARPMQALDGHLLQTLQADLTRQLTDIRTELERRVGAQPAQSPEDRKS